MFICVCKAVTDKQIKTAIDNGACSKKQLSQCLGVGLECGKCSRTVNQILDESMPQETIMHLA